MSALRSMVAAIFVILALPSACFAQDWPTRPIRFIVPFPAGGSTDVAARFVGEHLSRSLGQQIYIENKSGANGNVGIEAAAKSAPDGYTFLVSTDSIASNPHIYKMSVDVLKELVPVAQVSVQPIVLAAHPSLGVQSIEQLTAIAKRQRGLRYAIGGGVGSAQHIAMQWFAHLAGIELEPVPYRGGAQAINDLIAGHVKLGSLGSTPLIPHHQAGTLRLLAQSMRERATSLPDVPTFQEAGLNGLVLDQWVGVFAPVGAPATITSRLTAEISKALGDPTVHANLLKSGQDPVVGPTQQFAQFVREEFAKYARLVKELKIQGEAN